MSKVILPFTTDVEDKAYQYSAHALGAIKTSINNSNLWAAGKLLSIYFESNNQLHMNDADLWSINEGLTTQELKILNPSLNIGARSDLLNLIKHKISIGNYIVGMYDEYFIPNKDTYLKSHFLHDYLLYGFDDSQEVFKSAGYVANTKYEYFDIPYSAYIDSITLCDCAEIPLYFRYVHNQFMPELDFGNICEKLEDILLSRDNLPRQEGEPARIYGIAGLECYQKYIANFKYEKLDLRNSRSYMEYFQYMYLRLQALTDANYLCDRTFVDQYYTHMVQPSVMIYNMCLKYNICGNPEIVLRIGEYIEILNKRETQNIKVLLDKLDSCRHHTYLELANNGKFLR